MTLQQRRAAASAPDLPALRITEIRAPRDARIALEVDPRFGKRGIATGPQGRLIDSGATAARWGGPPGRRPEALLARHAPGAVGICPTNFGWQRGAFLVRAGKLIALPDDPLLDGTFTVLGLDERGWSTRNVDFVGGEPTAAADAKRLRTLTIGLEMPLLVSRGEIVPEAEVVATPRVLADLRNAFDFAAGRGTEIPQDAWGRLRSVMPASAESARALARGETCVELHATADAEAVASRVRDDVSRFGLDHVEVVGDTTHVGLRFAGPVPRQRLPLVGVGATGSGDLIVLAIDGRRTEAPGATIAELAELLRAAGAVDAGLGSAGGDVAVVARTAEGATLRNLASTDDPATGAPMTRPVPSLLVMR